jgi:hypothetical protein
MLESLEEIELQSLLNTRASKKDIKKLLAGIGLIPTMHGFRMMIALDMCGVKWGFVFDGFGRLSEIIDLTCE